MNGDAIGKIVVRAARRSDAADVHRITQEAFAELAGASPRSEVLAETEADVAADLGASGGLVAEFGGRPVAALRTAPEGHYSQALRRVRRVSVAPAARGHRIAAMLLERAAADAAADGLTALRAAVRAALPHNHAIYDELGWSVVERDAHWLSYGLALGRPVPDAAVMRDLGARLATLLEPGDLVVLAGRLGAGKTVFAQGIGRGLGVPDRVTSPTFVLVREHERGRVPLVHVDAYRLGSLAELDDLDLDTALPAAVTVVEWGAGLVEPLADGHLLVTIERSEDPSDEVRRVTLKGVGTAWLDRQQRLDVEC